MSWCEQISPLAHSSQATWQPFNLSHCIEMHKTHLLGRAGQLSQEYFTHLAPILTPCNLPPTVNKQWPPLRESRTSRHTRFNTSRKTATAAMNGIFLGTNAVDRSIRPSVRIRFCISIVSKYRNLSYLKYDSRICHWEAHPTLVKLETRPPRAGRACVKPFLFPVKSRRSLADFNTESIVCCLAQRVICQFGCIIIKI